MSNASHASTMEAVVLREVGTPMEVEALTVPSPSTGRCWSRWLPVGCATRTCT